jgi:RNA polymerase sigma-70 factor (ECF subfamily)
VNEAAAMDQALRHQRLLDGTHLVAEQSGTAPDLRFVALVERQSTFIFRVAFAVLRNTHDAEDAVQETFLKLYRTSAWCNIRDERSFIAKIAWRIAVRSLKRRRTETPDPDTPARGRSPEKAAIDADWSATVNRLVDALPEELRQPLALSALEELGSPEIAEIMGIPEGTVRTRILRARSILKRKLESVERGSHG